jgi:VIT1/CCC1 family predicted Fe2+/Mn2+ transporter
MFGIRIQRIVEPGDRIAEAMLGIIMALTFTGTLSVADAGRNDVRAMLIGALGCNLAWGIIDGIIYVMISAAQRGAELRALHGARDAGDPSQARGLIAGTMPAEVASVLSDGEFDSIRERLARAPAPPARVKLGTRDLLAGLGVCLIVFCSTLPIAVPFLLFDEVHRAMRWSNAIALALLFVAGWIYARHVGAQSWRFGVGMMAMGCVLVAITIALGG